MTLMQSERSDLSSFDKVELHELADELLLDDSAAIEQCVRFFEADTKGLWHGRARALMARRFKHCSLTPDQRTRLVRRVIERLLAGDISEQFRDQLRLALHLDAPGLLGAAQACSSDGRPYVRRYAEWVLSHKPRGVE